MNKKRVTVNEAVLGNNLDHDGCFGFYDWFCKDSSLKNRAEALAKKAEFLLKFGIIDGDKTYVWFKNNCPCNGGLYDDMRFSTADEADDFLGGVSPSSGHNSNRGECTVWYFKKDSNRTMVEHVYPSWMDFKKQVRTNPELLAELRNGFLPEAFPTEA